MTRAVGAVVLLVALVMIVAGCGGGSRKCTAQRGATESRCRCVLDQLEKTMPYSDFKRVDVEFRTRFGLSADERRKLVDAIAACS